MNQALRKSITEEINEHRNTENAHFSEFGVDQCLVTSSVPKTYTFQKLTTYTYTWNLGQNLNLHLRLQLRKNFYFLLI
jgi:hypothetical protein